MMSNQSFIEPNSSTEELEKKIQHNLGQTLRNIAIQSGPDVAESMLENFIGKGLVYERQAGVFRKLIESSDTSVLVSHKVALYANPENSFIIHPDRNDGQLIPVTEGKLRETEEGFELECTFSVAPPAGFVVAYYAEGAEDVCVDVAPARLESEGPGFAGRCIVGELTYSAHIFELGNGKYRATLAIHR